MPEWLLIVVAIAGIFLIGLFFSAIDLIKDFARVVFISLFVFLLILLANRLLAPDEPAPVGQNSYPPDSGFVEPNGQNNYPPNSEFIEPNGSQIEPSTGSNSNAGVSDYLRNLAQDLDEFVFGSQNQYGQQPSSPEGDGVNGNVAPSQNDFVYIFPEDTPEQNQIADQPVNQVPSRSTRTRSGAASSSGAVPAMW